MTNSQSILQEEEKNFKMAKNLRGSKSIPNKKKMLREKENQLKLSGIALPNQTAVHFAS